MARILVTGGAGFVGSFTTRQLVARGHDVLVWDNLSAGHREAVVEGAVLHVGDLRDVGGLAAIASGVDVVVHFAALLNVADSMRDPIAFYDTNVRGTLCLLEAMRCSAVTRLVVSSSCAVYGVPTRVPIDEDTPFAAINPYGASKAMMERILDDARRVGALSSFALRYFNAAGAAEDGRLGEAHHPETHLIPLAIAAALGGPPLRVFGSDHPTPDGTCVRDYVHVEDLAAAHARAVDLLLAGHPGGALNLGTGAGASVRDVIQAVSHRVGPVPVEDCAAREGDPPQLVAMPGRAGQVLGWTPRHDLNDIVRHAARWAMAPRFGPTARRSGHPNQ